MTAPPSLDDLVVFVRVVQLRSLSRAAQALGLPKSTVSRRLARLEDGLGVKLLHRTPRALTVTPLGAEYFGRCERVVAAADEAHEAIEAAREGPRGRVRIATPVVFGTEVLPAILLEFLAAHPEVEVDVVLGDQPVDLVAERFDLAVRVATKLPDSALKARVLGPATSVLVGSAAYLERAGRPRTPADLAAHPFVILGSGDPPRLSLTRGARTVEVALSGRVRTNNVFFARSLLLEGVGLGTVPEFLVRDCGDRLQTVLDGWGPPPMKLYAVHPPAPTAATRALLDRLVVAVAGRRPPDR